MLRVVSKKLEVTRRKVSRKWQHYRTLKRNIYARKTLAPEFKEGLRNELLVKTMQKISHEFESYRGTKYALTHRSDISDFSLSKKHTTQNTNQFYYKAKSNYDETKLDKLVPKLFEKKNIVGVSVILKVRDTEEDRIIYCSDFITKGLLKRLQEQGISIYDHLADKITAGYTPEFELMSIYIRTIYEK
jgi:hypothetical protein